MKIVGNKGFTLVEILITLVVLIILTTIATPVFKSIIQNNATSAETNSFISYVRAARQEAVNRGFPVVICSKRLGQRQCLSSNSWNNGWIIFEDRNENNIINSDDKIIQIGEKENEDVSIEATESNMVFYPNGFINQNINIEFNIRSCIKDNNKKISLSIPSKIKTTSISCN